MIMEHITDFSYKESMDITNLSYNELLVITVISYYELWGITNKVETQHLW